MNLDPGLLAPSATVVLVDPYLYVRAITLGLGAIWTLGGIRRMLRFTSLWSDRLGYVGLEPAWLRKQILIATVRATVLDPINLALILILFGSWGLRSLIG